MKRIFQTMVALALVLCVVTAFGCSKDNGMLVPPESVESNRPSDGPENPYGNDYRAYLLTEQFVEDFYQYNDGLGGALRYSLADNQGYGTAGCWNSSAFAQLLVRMIELYPSQTQYKDYFKDLIESYYDWGLGPLNPYHDVSKWAGKVIATHSVTNFQKWDGEGFVSWDDEMWILRSYLDAYEIFGDEEYLTMAKNICEFCIEDAFIPELGAFYWCDASNIIAPISNAPIARELLRTYSYLSEEEQQDPDAQIDGKHRYIWYAESAYHWVMETCLDPNDGCFFDFCAANIACDYRVSTENIRIEGMNQKKFDYTSGSMISAAVEFYRLTGEESWLDEAVVLMQDMFDYFALPYEIDGHTYYYFPTEGNSQWMNSVTLYGLYELSEFRYEECLPVINAFMEGINYGFDHYLLDGYISPYYLDGWLEGYTRCETIEGKDACGMAEMFALCSLFEKGVYEG